MCDGKSIRQQLLEIPPGISSLEWNAHLEHLIRFSVWVWDSRPPQFREEADRRLYDVGDPRSKCRERYTYCIIADNMTDDELDEAYAEYIVSKLGGDNER